MKLYAGISKWINAGLDIPLYKEGPATSLALSAGQLGAKIEAYLTSA